jgi:hypothetical protein
MASNKWTKWFVGLSGAALFTGFVGLMAGDKANAGTDTPVAASSETVTGEDGIERQWREQDRNMGGMRSYGFEQDGQIDQGDANAPSAPQSRSSGKLRTHAS